MRKQASTNLRGGVSVYGQGTRLASNMSSSSSMAIVLISFIKTSIIIIGHMGSEIHELVIQPECISNL